MHGAPKSDKYPVLNDPHTLLQYDAFLFGIPTRYGNFPAQWKVREKPCPPCEKRASETSNTDRRPPHSDLLGPHRRHLGPGRLYWQIRRRLRLDRRLRRRAGVHRHRRHEHPRPPRHHLRAPRLRPGLWPARRSERGPRRQPLGCRNLRSMSTPQPPNASSLTTSSSQAGDGSRQPSTKELELARIQGETFYQRVSRVNF